MNNPEQMFSRFVCLFGEEYVPAILAAMCRSGVGMLQFVAEKSGITLHELLKRIMEEETTCD